MVSMDENGLLYFEYVAMGIPGAVPGNNLLKCHPNWNGVINFEYVLI